MTRILPVVGLYQTHTSWLEVLSNGRLDLLTNQNKAAASSRSVANGIAND